MERTNLVVNQDEFQVVDGKVVISSEELAKAIQDFEVDPNTEEEANDNDIVLVQIKLFCGRK